MTIYQITIAALALLAAVSGILSLICEIGAARAIRRTLREMKRRSRGE